MIICICGYSVTDLRVTNCIGYEMFVGLFVAQKHIITSLTRVVLILRQFAGICFIMLANKLKKLIP